MPSKLNTRWFIGAANTVLSAILVLNLLTPRDAQAGLKDALGDMFLSTGTEAQAINTQRLKGFYAGSMSIRSPGRAFEVVQFAAPKIDAGCGGIDIFFGSFSFINGAQFEQLIRAIAANAVGYAVKLAITSMCNPCGAVLEKLEEAIRELNALAKNTCAIAKQSPAQTMDKIMESGRKIGEALSVAANRIADSTAASNKSHSEPPSKTATGGDENVANSNPVLGNMVWRASQQTMDAGNNTLKAFLTTKQATEMVQSIFGTLIVRAKEDTDKPCEAGVAGERCDNAPLPIGSTLTRWDKLLKARSHSPEGVSLLRCTNATCTTTQVQRVPLSEWGGVQDIVNLALFGTTDIHNQSLYTPDSLVGSFILKRQINTNGSNLSPRARQMAEIIPIPALLMLMELQNTPGAARSLGLQLSMQLPKYFEYILALELLNIGANTFSNQNVVDMPDEFKRNLTEMSRQLDSMQPDAKDVKDMMEGAYTVIKGSQLLTTSPIRASSRQK